MLNTKNNNDAKEFIRLALYNEEKRENYTEINESDCEMSDFLLSEDSCD